MYRQYKALPEFNRVCIKASRDRAYQQHMDALKRMKPSVDTRQPLVPQTIGRNYKRYENEMQRNAVITRDNSRLLNKIDSYQRQEHYPRATPQRPFTLQGQAQRDEMWRITHENHKLLTAVQERKPILNRNDWLRHKLDHEYQITKMSEFKKTVPMSEILRQETGCTSLKSRPHTTFGSVTSKSNTHRSQSASNAGDHHSDRADLDEEVDNRTDALLPPQSNSAKSDSGRLEKESDKRADALISQQPPKQQQSQPPTDNTTAKNKANLEEENDNRANALLPNDTNEADSGMQKKSGNVSPQKQSPNTSKTPSPPPEDEKDDGNDGALEGQSNAITGALLGDL